MTAEQAAGERSLTCTGAASEEAGRGGWSPLPFSPPSSRPAGVAPLDSPSTRAVEWRVVGPESTGLPNTTQAFQRVAGRGSGESGAGWPRASVLSSRVLHLLGTWLIVRPYIMLRDVENAPPLGVCKQRRRELSNGW